MEEFITFELFGNSVGSYMTALIILLLTIVLLLIIKAALMSYLKKIAALSSLDIDDLIVNIVKKISWVFYLFTGIYVAAQFLALPETINTILHYAFIVVATYEGIKAIQIIIDYAAKKYIARDGAEANIKGLTLIVKIVLWVVAIVLILANLGYDVNSLIASLGIGGIAVALAVQNILGDVFCSFTIYLDKPFSVGDSIKVGEYTGTVKKIGIKSTRMQTLDGDELIISNQDLTNSRIRNYKKMQKRRVAFDLVLDYETSKDTLNQLPGIIKQIIQSIELLDYSRVHLKKYGEYGLIVEVVYYVNSSDYTAYMDKQHEFKVVLLDELKKQKIKLAFPVAIALP